MNFNFRKLGTSFSTFSIAFISCISVISCQKKSDPVLPPADPAIRYTDLGNSRLSFGQSKAVDLNDDGVIDIRFSTMGVGDPVYRQDKLKYYLNGMLDTYSLVNEQEESPIFQAGDSIRQINHPGYNWYNASAIVLAEKIIPETGNPFWQGNWKNVNHRYFPLQVRKADGSYQAWVELSFSTQSGEMILHRAAIAKQAGISIAAGR